MATYDTKLKRSKDGRIFRYLGRDSQGRQIKFSLGFDAQSAELKASHIQTLWEAVEEQHGSKPGNASWDDSTLAAAKAIASGKAATLAKSDYEAPEKYFTRINSLSRKGVTVQPENQFLFDAGKADLIADLTASRKVLAEAIGVSRATGVTLKEAFQQFEDFIRKQSSQPDESITTTGKTIIDELGGIVARFLPQAYTIKNGQRVSLDLLSMDLGQLDFAACQEVYDTIRKRPVSEVTGQRIGNRYALNMVKILTRFFDWLDISDLDWSEPPKFRKIKKTVDPLTADEQFSQSQKKSISVIPLNHLEIIARYCRPNERVLLLLGLNCAFGEGEVGQLRIPFIKDNTIDGIRFKTGNATKHLLWDETVRALKETIAARPKMKPDHQIVIVSGTGKPLYSKTKIGNYSNGIVNRWLNVMDRVRKDHPEIPNYSFNKLRKTAATNILRLCSAESASMILAHKTISDDELLECYVTMPWDKLFEAQRKWGEQILPLIPAPTMSVPVGGGSIGLAKIQKIIKLQATGLSNAAIGRQVGCSGMTVGRMLAKLQR